MSTSRGRWCGRRWVLCYTDASGSLTPVLPLGGTGVLFCLEALDSRNVCVYAQHMDTTQDTMRPRTIRMTDAMWKALDDLAYARRIRAADVAREAIETYLVASHQGAAQKADPSARIIGKPASGEREATS